MNENPVIFPASVSPFRQPRIVWVVIVALLAAFFVTQGATPAFAITASISGNVQGGGANLAGVTVSAQTINDEVRTAVTDASGNYIIGGLQLGNYTLRFTPGPESGWIAQWFGNHPDLSSAQFFNVYAGQTVIGRNAVLDLQSTVDGHVTDSSSVGIVGVDVNLVDATRNYVGHVQTTSGGAFHIVGVRSGSYTLSFTPNTLNYVGKWWNDQLDFPTANFFAVGVGQAVTGKDATLSAGATISGHVTNSALSPLGSVQVIAYSQSDSFTQSASTNSSGDYTLIGLPADYYLVGFTGGGNYAPTWWNAKPDSASADNVILTLGANRTGVGAVMPDGATIVGSIYGDIGSPSVTYVTAYLADGTRASSTTVTGGGMYSISGLAAGSYTLHFDSPPFTGFISDWWNGQPTQSVADYFAVSAGATVTGRNVILQHGTTISGTLTDDMGGPFNGAGVVLYRAGGASDGTAVLVDSTTTTAGAYSFTGVPIGSYKVGFSTYSSGYSSTGALALSDPYVSKFYGGAYTYSGAQTVTVSALNTTVTLGATALDYPLFGDVGPTSAFYTEMQWMSTSGISLGTVQPFTKSLYKPNDPVSRQAMALFLYRLSGDTYVPPTEQTFADVAPGTTFYTAVEWMANRGISFGTAQPGGKPLYKPVDPVSRRAMSLFLVRYHHVDLSTPPTIQRFTDVHLDGSAATTAIEWMATSGISTGYPDHTFQPDNPVRRFVMAAFLYRLAHLVI